MPSRNKALTYVSDGVPVFAQYSQETVGRAEAKKMLTCFSEKETLKVSVLLGLELM